MMKKLIWTITIIFLTACSAISAPTTPISFEQEQEPLNDLTPCEESYCWKNLPLSELDPHAVTMLISRDALFSNVSPDINKIDEEYTNYIWLKATPTGKIVDFVQYTAYQDNFFLLARTFPAISFNDVILKFGEPSHILVAEGGSGPSHGPWIHFTVYYEKIGLIFSSQTVRYANSDDIFLFTISPEAPIISYTLTYPDSVTELIRTQLLASYGSHSDKVDRTVELWKPFIQLWHGYGDYKYMKEWEGLLPEYR